MNRPREHRFVQREAKKRDGYICAVCGRKFKPTAHHIIDYSLDGTASMQDMITLCKECHDAYHAGKIKLDIISY